MRTPNPTHRQTARFSLLGLSGLAILLLVSACGGQEPAKTDTKTEGAAADGEDAAADADAEDGASDDGTDGTSTSTIDPVAAAKLWVDSVKPALERECATCHAEPRFTVPNRGPLTIFSYDAVKKMLGDGTSSTDNKMIRKPLGEDSHGGGVRCTVAEEPCSLLVQLRKLEFGADASSDDDPNISYELPADADPRLAAVASVSTGGLVMGWAVNKDDLRSKVTLRLILDGPLGTGTLVATTTADKLGDDGKHPGDHGFFVQVAAEHRTGVERDLYLYDDKDQLLTPTPLKFKAYSPTAAGRAYFDATVAPKIVQKCSNCHQASYATFYGALSVKGPNEGGTASNNNAVNKPGGVAAHNGGNACGGINSSPCLEFQTWWTKEF